MAITKPPVLPAWAESGDKVTPSNAEIQVGWPLSSIPPSRQRFNWLLNFLANGIRYFSRRGLPDYDATETYMTGDRIIGDDGKTYRSLVDNNTAQTPSTSPTKWELWALTQSQGDARVQNNSAIASVAGGTADAITATYTPAVTALTNGMSLYVRAGSANATTTPTFTPASGTIPAKTIVKGASAALAVGDIAGGGHWIELQYDLTLDKWVLQNPATGVTSTVVGDASTTVKGKVQLATNAEAQAGTDTTKAITPDDLAKTMLGGVGQAWVDVTASRSKGTNYTNSTGRPILVSVMTGGNTTSTLTVDGVVAAKNIFTTTNTNINLLAIVPAGATYSVSSGANIVQWSEFK